MKNASRALIVIDVQNDYFPGGAYPLWNGEETLTRIEEAIALAQTQELPILYVQHLAPARPGGASFFTTGTAGAEIHPRLRAAAPQATVTPARYSPGPAFCGMAMVQ